MTENDEDNIGYFEASRRIILFIMSTIFEQREAESNCTFYPFHINYCDF